MPPRQQSRLRAYERPLGYRWSVQARGGSRLCPGSRLAQSSCVSRRSCRRSTSSHSPYGQPEVAECGIAGTSAICHGHVRHVGRSRAVPLNRAAAASGLSPLAPVTVALWEPLSVEPLVGLRGGGVRTRGSPPMHEIWSTDVQHPGALSLCGGSEPSTRLQGRAAPCDCSAPPRPPWRP